MVGWRILHLLPIPFAVFALHEVDSMEGVGIGRNNVVGGDWRVCILVLPEFRSGQRDKRIGI